VLAIDICSSNFRVGARIWMSGSFNSSALASHRCTWLSASSVYATLKHDVKFLFIGALLMLKTRWSMFFAPEV